MSCIYCQIINRELESKIVYEDKWLIVFWDIHPRAPLHLLIVPKEHIEELYLLEKKEIWSKILKTVKKLVIVHNLAGKGYRMVINGGGAQQINHLHVHLMGEISVDRNV